jgi:hypothetical protein
MRLGVALYVRLLVLMKVSARVHMAAKFMLFGARLLGADGMTQCILYK